MAEQFDAALAALAYAIMNEQAGYVFYKALSEHVRDPRGQEMFKGLGQDEEQHYHLLVAEYESIRTGKGWLSVSDALAAEVPGIEEFRAEQSADRGAAVPDEPLFPSPDEVVSVLEAETGDLEAMDMALEAEKRGYELYQAAHRAASDPLAKKAYQLLMEEENKHYTGLQQSREYLTNFQTYWDDSELPFFIG